MWLTCTVAGDRALLEVRREGRMDDPDQLQAMHAVLAGVVSELDRIGLLASRGHSERARTA
jgi:hypothetical protein